MEIIYADQDLDPKYESYLKNDRDPNYVAIPDLPRSYRVDRSMAEMLERALISLNFFRYLADVSQELNRSLEVLEGGCGYGYTLRDLKSGVRGLGELSRMPYKELRWRENGAWYFERFAGDSFPGLGVKIRTTGVSLSREHPEVAANVNAEERIDEFVVGSIGQYPFGRQYDCILDSLGAAYYFPNEVIPVYGKILEPDGIAFMRLKQDPLNYMQDGWRKLEALMRSNHLEIVAKAGDGLQVDVICKGTGFPLLCRAQYSEVIAVTNKAKYTSPYYFARELL